MPVKFMNSTGFAFNNVSSMLIRGPENAPMTGAEICKIRVRAGSIDGEILGTIILDPKANDTRQFIFPQQANGRNFDPPDGVFFEYVQGDADLTITGDND